MSGLPEAQVINKIEKLSHRQKELSFSDQEYSLLLNLEKNFGEENEFVLDVRELSDRLRDHIFENWAVQQTARKTVERDVRRFVRKYVKRHGLKLDELMAHLIERKHNEKFWKIVSNKFKNYEENEKELFEYWFLIQTVVNNNKP